MRRSRRAPVRLAAVEGVLVEDLDLASGIVTLTIEEIRRGRVRITAENDMSDAVDHRVYRLLGEEALLTAVRSVLHPGERPRPLRIHLEPFSEGGSHGPIEAVASAVRLGSRASIATVVICTGRTVIGRGGLVSVVMHATVSADRAPGQASAV